MAEDDDGLIGVELLVGSRGYIAHGHQEGIRQAGKVELPRFANVQKERFGRVLELFGEGFDTDLWCKHGNRINPEGRPVRDGETAMLAAKEPNACEANELVWPVENCVHSRFSRLWMRQGNGTLKSPEASKVSIRLNLWLGKQEDFGASSNRRR